MKATSNEHNLLHVDNYTIIYLKSMNILLSYRCDLRHIAKVFNSDIRKGFYFDWLVVTTKQIIIASEVIKFKDPTLTKKQKGQGCCAGRRKPPVLADTGILTRLSFTEYQAGSKTQGEILTLRLILLRCLFA